MQSSRQKGILFSVVENGPTIAFFALLHLTNDLRLAGWGSAIFAVIIGIGYLTNTLKPHPILLGINIYMLIITPVVEFLILIDLNGLASGLVKDAQSSVLVAIFVTGCILTAVTKNGFVGVSSEDRIVALQYSLILLFISLVTVVWSFAVDAERIVKIGLPLLVLFGTRQFLIARLVDQTGRNSDKHLLIIAGANLPEQDLDLSA